MIDKIREYLRDAIKKRIFPGCAAGIYRNGYSEVIALGNYTYECGSQKIQKDSIFDVASITKAIPVSSLALKLFEKGIIKNSDRLIDFVPEFKGDYREKIQVKHLLTHTLNFDFRLSECKDKGYKGILEAIFNAKLKALPGENFFYANATSILLGLVIERSTGKKLDVLADETFFTPLKMKNTSFHPDNFDKNRIVPTEIDSWRGRLLQGEIHDESAWALRPQLIAGSAGLFSSVPDLLNFVSMILNDGCFENEKLLKPETIAQMHTNQRPDKTGEWAGMGWELNQANFMGNFRNKHTFGKTGFTGCCVVMDPVKNCGFVLLSNHIYPKRNKNRELINKVRSNVADFVLEKKKKITVRKL